MRSPFLRPLLVLLMVAGCAAPAAQDTEGWFDADVHAVDGYWMTNEMPCAPELDPDCALKVEAAVEDLARREPEAVVTAAHVAGYPVSRQPGDISVAVAGIMQPGFVVLDLADGSRRAVGLLCGPIRLEGDVAIAGCRPSELELYRVGQAHRADGLGGG